MPSLVSKGTASKTGAASGTPAAVTPAYPGTVAANDVFILQVIVGTISGQTVGRFTAPAGWEEITQGGFRTSAGAIRGQMGWFWKRGDGTETGTVSCSTTFSSTNESGFHGQIYRITGCPTTGIPWESVAPFLQGEGATTITWLATDVGGTGRLVLAFVGQLDDTPGASVPTNYTDTLGIDADATNQDTQLEVFEKTNTNSGAQATAAGGETAGWATLHMAFHASVQAEVSPVCFRGAGISDSSSDTLAINPILAIPAGVLLFVAAASDNTATVIGETSEHQISNSVGNVWTKLREHCRTAGVVADGATVSLWMTKTTIPIGTGDTVTLTLSAARTSKVFTLYQATVAPNRTLTLVAANGATGNDTAPTVALSGLASGTYYYVGAFGSEGSPSIVIIQDGAYTPGGFGGTGAGTPDFVTSGAGATSLGMRVGFGSRLVTGSTGDTYAVAGSATVDWAAVFAALQLADDAPPAPSSRRNIMLLGVQ
jgi:hypothetical protein